MLQNDIKLTNKILNKEYFYKPKSNKINHVVK